MRILKGSKPLMSLNLIAERRRSPSPILIDERIGNQRMDFLKVIMASGIAPRHVRLTAATESRKTSAIFQIIGSLRIYDFGTPAPTSCCFQDAGNSLSRTSSTLARSWQVLRKACAVSMSRNLTAASCKSRRFVSSLIG